LVVLIFLHLPNELREKVFKDSINSLKRKGILLVEAFQINNSSGGPQSLDLLYSENDVLSLVKDLRTEKIEAKSIELDEGAYHKGNADVIRYVGVKS